MSRRRGLIAALPIALCAAALTLGSSGSAEPPFGTESMVEVGKSLRGVPIRALRLGDPSSPRKALVVGSIHGDEPGGVRVTEEIRRSFGDLTGVDLWLIDRVNPDGLGDQRRGNAHGVDLNRNFPFRWRGGRRGRYYPGPRPLSEPESQAIADLVRKLQPAVSVWYHQPWDRVLMPCNGAAPLQRTYARIAREKTSCRGSKLRGTVISWQNHSFPGTTAMVVELGAGRVGTRTVRRHANAAVAITRGAGATSASGSAAAAPPAIKDWLIPYGPRRKAQMAAYSKRHYGQAQWQLTDPKLVVEHYSETATARQVFNIFAANQRDPELHELPGVCAHYVISPKGAVYRLVPETTRCRHVIGLNQVAIGIEHVGFSDRQVMGRKAQLQASLRLTQDLRCRYGLPIGNVIGHAESLSSPFYLEKVKSARGQTHGDFRHRTMGRYRRALAAQGPC